MTSIHKHRIIALTLAIIFAVFNIGLPIVVASCPMMKLMDSNKCMICDDGSASRTVKLTNAVDKSCCATKFAAESNKTEFLQSSQIIENAKQHYDVHIIAFNSVPGLQSPDSRLPLGDSSPPRTRDIPIFISSLLI